MALVSKGTEVVNEGETVAMEIEHERKEARVRENELRSESVEGGAGVNRSQSES
ncbi:hypothetical protein RchiOBHm_Chr1g0355821 [Rosa chinensis]|uniref:Uncharacterized protein n=1 Tax=Rosa chinensis TaxID=74649 RepID=A0A2P6SHG0_ROSCH|nr:hypothetical protein RchiOBHm_Chr1g0355821 [Rosa chinensis]